MYDPVAELRKRGVFVRLVIKSGEQTVQTIGDGRKMHALEQRAHDRWVRLAIARYISLITMQLSMADKPGEYRSVNWLVSHGYLKISEGRYVRVRK